MSLFSPSTPGVGWSWMGVVSSLHCRDIGTLLSVQLQASTQVRMLLLTDINYLYLSAIHKHNDMMKLCRRLTVCYMSNIKSITLLSHVPLHSSGVEVVSISPGDVPHVVLQQPGHLHRLPRQQIRVLILQYMYMSCLPENQQLG